jgi:hypothetical protein
MEGRQGDERPTIYHWRSTSHHRRSAESSGADSLARRGAGYRVDLWSPAEGRFLGAVGMWFFQKGYMPPCKRPGHKRSRMRFPDSPVGLAGWIVERFRAWSDCNGEIENICTKDEPLTNIMIYWVTGTISSSARLYHEDGLQSAPQLSEGQYIRGSRWGRHLPQGSDLSAARAGRTLPAGGALDRDATRRAFCLPRSSGTARSGGTRFRTLLAHL